MVDLSLGCRTVPLLQVHYSGFPALGTNISMKHWPSKEVQKQISRQGLYNGLIENLIKQYEVFSNFIVRDTISVYMYNKHEQEKINKNILNFSKCTSSFLYMYISTYWFICSSQWTEKKIIRTKYSLHCIVGKRFCKHNINYHNLELTIHKNIINCFKQISTIDVLV